MQSDNHRIGLIGFSIEDAHTFKNTDLTIAAHIYSNEQNKKKSITSSPSMMNIHDWKSYRFKKNYDHHPGAEFIKCAKALVFDEFIRCTDRWPWSSELVANWNDYDHLFTLACIHAHGWISEHNINCLVYSNVPHQGIALAQYATAKQLGLKTLVFCQSPIAGRSFLVEDWKDLGKFNTSLEGEKTVIEISPPKEPPFYMASTKGNFKRKATSTLKRLRAKLIVSLGLTGITKKKRRQSFLRNSKRWQNAVQDKHYLDASSNRFRDTIGKTEYIYFPLHLQPEMTTDVLGEEYADQLLAIETLRNIIPDDLEIYVKENPKQTGLMRSDVFFKRLEKIPNTRLLSRDTSSFELIKNAKAVATITGTAGWEALRIGKPVIVFGNIFWNHLPGAFHIGKKPTWQDISAFEFSASKLQEAANQVSGHAHECVCDKAYSVMLEEFDEARNAHRLSSLIKRYLEA